MAGHSKWANIQHRKAGQDAKRGKLFTKFIREITISARMGGEDPASNPRLRAAIDKALGGNMTRDTIERAIKRGIGADGAAAMEEMTYEGYGPGGVAVMVECTSDNRNRTVAEVRHAFSKHGGNMGTSGSVSYLFDKKGQFLFAPGVSEDKLMEVALEAGAEDVVALDDGAFEVLSSPELYFELNDAFSQAGLKPESNELALIPSTTSAVEGEVAQKVLKLIDMLEELDDVQNVYTNAEFSDEALAAL